MTGEIAAVLFEAAFAKHHRCNGKTWCHLVTQTNLWSTVIDPEGVHLGAAIGTSAGIFDSDAASVGMMASVVAFARDHDVPVDFMISDYVLPPMGYVKPLHGHRTFLEPGFLEKLDHLDNVKNTFSFEFARHIDLKAPEDGLKRCEPAMYVSETTGYDFPDRPAPEHTEVVEKFFKSI